MSGIFNDEMRAQLERTENETKQAFQSLSEQARNAIQNLTSSVASIESQINSTASFADDLTVSLADVSNDVFEDSLLTNPTSAAEGVTRSVTDDSGRQVFVFRGENEELKRAYNISGKRFERALGTKAVRNDVIQLKPVSSKSYFNSKSNKCLNCL